MKTIFYGLTFALFAMMMACGDGGTRSTTFTRDQPATQDVVKTNADDHDHDGHNHDGHNHDGHDHAHDASSEVPEGTMPVIEKLDPDGVKQYALDIQQKLATVKPQSIDVSQTALDAGGVGMWNRMDVYRLDDKIVQIEVLPVQGTITETFFYKNWELVMAYVDPNGRTRSILDDDPNALKYYYNRDEFAMPSVEGMGLPTGEQIRRKGQMVMNVAVNTK